MYSLLPVLMNETGKSLNDSTKDIIDRLQYSVRNFEEVSAKLYAMVENDAETLESLRRYIELLAYNITGNYTWRFVTRLHYCKFNY